MKAFEIRELSSDELKKRIKDEEENLIHLRFQHALGQLESPAKLRTIRRDLARMKTVLQERALNIQREIKKPEAAKQERSTSKE